MLLVSRICFWLAIPVLAFAAIQPVVTRAADESPGLEVGASAPDFKLTDHQGKQQQLAELLKRGGVAIVFYRSAAW